jgi:hypothetical protein
MSLHLFCKIRAYLLENPKAYEINNQAQSNSEDDML